MTRAPLVSGALVAGGLFLLGWVGWSVLNPGAPPYRYELVTQGAVGEFPELGLAAPPDLSVLKYELRADDAAKPLVTLHVGDRGDQGPVLLDWQNQLAEPLLTMAPPIAELATLATAVAKHVPQGAVLLGWWDTARRLGLLAGSDTPFQQNLGRPLLIPAAWSARRNVIEAFERSFWRVPDGDGAAVALFERFQEALLADQASGATMLSELAKEREAYLVLHVSDVYKLGATHPEALGIGYKDFPRTGEIHGMIGHIKEWLREQGHESHVVEKRGATSVRVYFLTDAASQDTLIARALPFTTSSPLELEELRLVYQHGGYWVYQIAPDKKETDT